MSLRRTFAAAAATASLILATACSGPASGGGGDTLTIFSWDGEETMAPIIAKFEADNPGLKVEFTHAPPVTEYISTLQTRVLSGTAADVFAIAAENKTNLIEGKHVVDLTGKPYLKQIPEFNQETYSGPDGKVYGMSIGSWGGGILYNEDLLAEVGASEIPQTWDEFVQLCHQLKDAGTQPYLESVQGIPLPVNAFLGAINESTDNTMDAKIFNDEAKFVDYWVEPLQQWVRLWEEDLVTRDAVGLTGDQVREEFINGRVAMIPTGPWDIPTVREAAPEMKIKMVPIPGLAGSEPYLAGAANPGFAINAKAKNPEAAEKFLTFMSSPEAVELYQKQAGAITVTKDYVPEIDPALDPILEDIRDGKLYLPMISWKRSEDVLLVEGIAQVQLLVQGQATAEQVAAALDAKLAAS